MVEGGIKTETRQALDNIDAILNAADSLPGDIVKVTVFVEDMADFGSVNDIYEEFVSEPFPARSAVEVSDLAMEFTLEIEVTAAL